MRTARKFVLIGLVLFLLSLGSSPVVFGQQPTAEPTDEATTEPTVEPTDEATTEPTAEPTDEATTEPTAEPTDEATTEPTVEPTSEITATATITPTVASQEIGTSAIVNPPGQSSNVLLQNTANTGATVTVIVYNSAGTELFNNTFTIAANGSRTIHAGSGTNDTGHLYMNLPSNSEASMVVQSSTRLVATNVNFGSPSVHNIYEGLDSTNTATDILLPSIHWREVQYSIIGIQNAGSSPANIEIRYFRQNGSQIGSTITVNGLAVGASHIRRSHQDVSIASEPAGVGSVRVTSTNGQALAASVIETLFTNTSSYNGIPVSAADTKWSFPSVHRNPAGGFSHILVQNTNQTSAANVNLRYFNQNGTQVNQFLNISIPAKGALTFHTTNALSDNGGNYTPTNLGNVGSATVESTNGVKLVATVLETVGAFPYAYNGFNNSAGATTVLLPSVHRNPGGQFSHALVQNTSTSSNNITITYFKQDGSVANTFNKTLAGSGSITFHTDGAASSDGNTYLPTNLGNVGSAKVVSTSGIPIVAVMVETVFGLPGAYNGFK